jgi:hypothetical protein
VTVERIGRLGAALLFVVLGLLVGLAGTLSQQRAVSVGDVRFPLGLVLGLLAFGALLAAARLLFPGRAEALGLTIGALVANFGLSQQGASGDSVLVPNNMLGILWTLLPVLVALVALAWPRVSLRRPATA